MTEYYEEKWLDDVEARFETIVKASTRARKINEGGPDSEDENAKVVVKALREIVQEDGGVVQPDDDANDKAEDSKAEEKAEEAEDKK